MEWYEPVNNGFEGLNSFFGQVSPYLFPILLILFIGGLVLYAGRKVALAVS